jgi:hypothetical protein
VAICSFQASAAAALRAGSNYPPVQSKVSARDNQRVKHLALRAALGPC